MLPPRNRCLAVLIAVSLVLLPTIASASKKEHKLLLDFALRMAKEGNWREALYRWERAAGSESENPYLLNNIAVALEALGRHEEAGEYYDRAVSLSADNEFIRENARRLESFQESLGKDEPSSGPAERPEPDRGRRGKGPKPVKVQIRMPVPPRLDLTGVSSLLVASFLTDRNEEIDTGREMVRFLRSEFRNETGLDVLDVTPAPAVPEQRLEDLIRNVEFWKHLGRKYDADLIVSGYVVFDVRDVSGFRDVDMISNITGQKVRTTQFVEEEEFTYQVDLLFFDGKTGELRFRDRLSRRIRFQGLSNDSLAAFFALSEQIAADVLSVVSSSSRQEQRVLFQG